MNDLQNKNNNMHLVERAHRGLAQVWIDFESSLIQVPIIDRLMTERFRLIDYQRLLLNLRQQVIEGSRWISRAASNISYNHEELRSLFLEHAITEHRDYRMLEDNFVAAGGNRDDILSAHKNIGSEAFSGFMYNSASQKDPIGLLGAMFIIEGLGERVAGPWSQKIAAQLELPDEAFTFFTHHADHDGDHLDMFDRAITLVATHDDIVVNIIRHAKIVARLYRLQLEEIDNV